MDQNVKKQPTQAEFEALQKQLAEAQAKLAAAPIPKVTLKMTEKGQLSIAGLKPGWGMYMRPEDFNFLDSKRDQIKAFIAQNPKAGDKVTLQEPPAAPTK